MRFRNVIFDLDGTLTDPKEGITRSIRHALKQMGRELPSPEELLWCIGPPLRESFRKLLGTDEVEPVEEAMQYYRVRYGKIGMFENRMYEGVPEFLERLYAADVQLYVASSKPWKYVEKILEHFGLARFFVGMHGPEMDGTRGKKSELLRYVIEKYGFRVDETVMVGDRKHDVLGAKANRLASVGVTYGYGQEEELRKAGADWICQDLEELKKIIARMD